MSLDSRKLMCALQQIDNRFQFTNILLNRFPLNAQADIEWARHLLYSPIQFIHTACTLM